MIKLNMNMCLCRALEETPDAVVLVGKAGLEAAMVNGCVAHRTLMSIIQQQRSNSVSLFYWLLIRYCLKLTNLRCNLTINWNTESTVIGFDTFSGHCVLSRSIFLPYVLIKGFILQTNLCSQVYIYLVAGSFLCSFLHRPQGFLKRFSRIWL